MYTGGWEGGWLYGATHVLEQQKQGLFHQTHYQGLSQFFLIMSWYLRAKHVTPDGVLLSLEFQKQRTTLDGHLVSTKSPSMVWDSGVAEKRMLFPDEGSLMAPKQNNKVDYLSACPPMIFVCLSTLWVYHTCINAMQVYYTHILLRQYLFILKNLCYVVYETAS